jgi:hypothetical protein
LHKHAAKFCDSRRTIVSSINPIEMLWAQIKGYVASNKTFKSLEVKTLFVEGLRQVTAQNWQNYISHVLRQEENI